jgi:hypothetical protein
MSQVSRLPSHKTVVARQCKIAGFGPVVGILVLTSALKSLRYLQYIVCSHGQRHIFSLLRQHAARPPPSFKKKFAAGTGTARCESSPAADPRPRSKPRRFACEFEIECGPPADGDSCVECATRGFGLSNGLALDHTDIDYVIECEITLGAPVGRVERQHPAAPQQKIFSRSYPREVSHLLDFVLAGASLPAFAGHLMLFLVLLIKKRTPKIVSWCCSIVIAHETASNLDASVYLQKYTLEYL